MELRNQFSLLKRIFSGIPNAVKSKRFPAPFSGSVGDLELFSYLIMPCIFIFEDKASRECFVTRLTRFIPVLRFLPQNNVRVNYLRLSILLPHSVAVKCEAKQ